MSILNDYLKEVCSIVKIIVKKEEENITRVADLAAKMVEEDRLIHVFGTGGYSIMGGMEVFYRAGGLVNINPLFPAGLSLIDSHPNIERTTGLSKSVLQFYGVKKGDLLIIVNVNGINSLSIDAVIYGKEIGATTVGITSPDFAWKVPSNISARHPSNQNLHDLVDIVIDVHVPMGDALLSLDGLQQKVGASSTYAVCFAANLIIAKTIEVSLERGIKPPVWTSMNVEGGDEANKKYMEKYISRIHHLYPMF